MSNAFNHHPCIHFGDHTSIHPMTPAASQRPLLQPVVDLCIVELPQPQHRPAEASQLTGGHGGPIQQVFPSLLGFLAVSIGKIWEKCDQPVGAGCRMVLRACLFRPPKMRIWMSQSASLVMSSPLPRKEDQIWMDPLGVRA